MTPAASLTVPSITTQELFNPKAADQVRMSLLHLLRELIVLAAAVSPFLFNSWFYGLFFAGIVVAPELAARCARAVHPARTLQEGRTEAFLGVIVVWVLCQMWPSTYSLPFLALYVAVCLMTAFGWVGVKAAERSRPLGFLALLLVGMPAVAATWWACGIAWAAGLFVIGAGLAYLMVVGIAHVDGEIASLPPRPHEALSQLDAEGDQRAAKRLRTYLANWQAKHLSEIAAAAEAAFPVIADPNVDKAAHAAAISALYEIVGVPTTLRMPASTRSLRSDAWRVVDFDFDARTQERDDEERLSYDHDIEWLEDLRAKTAELLALEELGLETPDEHRAAAAIDGRHVRFLRNRLALIDAALAASAA